MQQETILSTLKAEHREVDSLIEQIENCKDFSKKQELFSDLIESILPHMEGEEKTLYSKLQNEVDQKMQKKSLSMLTRSIEKLKCCSKNWTH